MKSSIILATSNAGKIKEFRALLSPRECIPQKELNISDADETGSTFIENALLKARHASHISNMPAMADDSGLVIPALKGKPGIYSSRFAGVHATDGDNIKRVLHLLEDVSQQDTGIEAFFYSAVVLIQHADDPTPLFGTGILKGQIVSTPKGTHGFGYDPIFYLPDQECTLAELPLDIKNTFSHRARALQALAKQYNRDS
ncbi:MAG: RdgB/HAM1 family non-canonical purine NTP pyrophosphatase [Gammaproteobacteria bacterium]|nr:RdgB/HAM1 family non-canonical purine NTP pyrophosphatase [Gammaproteobacteria bacterium]